MSMRNFFKRALNKTTHVFFGKGYRELEIYRFREYRKKQRKTFFGKNESVVIEMPVPDLFLMQVNS